MFPRTQTDAAAAPCHQNPQLKIITHRFLLVFAALTVAAQDYGFLPGLRRLPRNLPLGV
jgi:hypothetical protein